MEDARRNETPGQVLDVLLPRPRSARLSGRFVDVAWEGAGLEGARLIVREKVPGMRAQGYRMAIDASGIRVEAADAAGAFYARKTLEQLRRASPADRLPEGTIEDWPDIAVRGVMLDLSRDKVPTMETLHGLLDRLAAWRCNHVELYMEHTFAYPGHRTVWEEASPLDADDIGDLGRHCAELHIDLVANQNTLGHMERWLCHERYRKLALAPGGFRDFFGLPRSPSTLDPRNEDAFALVSELLSELAGHFDAPLVNIGLDEPWELQAGDPAEWLRWLSRLRGIDSLSGRRLLVWGDVLALHPELIPKLADGVVVGEWGYEHNHPWEERLGRLSEAGQASWVCVGTSSWLSVLGRSANMMGNCASGARAAIEHGCEGYLATEWGDCGYLQPLAVAEPGLAFAMACAWCVETNAGFDVQSLARALDCQVFLDEANRMGSAILGLGNLYRELPLELPNMSGLVMNCYYPQLASGVGLTSGMTPEHLARIAETLAAEARSFAGGRSSRADGGVLLSEVAYATELVALLVADHQERLKGDGQLGSVTPPARTLLRDRLDGIMVEHERAWHARNRRGGFDASRAWLAHLQSCYESGYADPEWNGPLAARFFRDHPLP